MAEGEAAAEWVRLNDELVAVPAAVCEHEDAFNAAVSGAGWEALSEPQQQHLRSFLPSFGGGEEGRRQQDDVIRQLLSASPAAGEQLRQLVGSPRQQLFSQLHSGQLTDEIYSLRRLTAETKADDAKMWMQTYQSELLQELLIKRKQLLDVSVRSTPDAVVRAPVTRRRWRRGDLEQRVKKRYFQEVELARAEAGCDDAQLSPDESYPEGAPAGLTRRQQRRLHSLEASLGADHLPLSATTSRRHQHGLQLVHHVTAAANPFELTDNGFSRLLKNHRKRRAKEGFSSSLASSADPSIFPSSSEDLQRLLKQALPPAPAGWSDSDSDASAAKRRPTKLPNSKHPHSYSQSSTSQLSSSHTKPAATMAPDASPVGDVHLGLKLHCCFFSVLRDVFCSDPHDRLPEAQLFQAVRQWQESGAASNNDWFQMEANWLDVLPSALAFLSGELPELQGRSSLVPFLDHSESTGIYQWIGAGRDSDLHLASLCALWTQRRSSESTNASVNIPAAKKVPSALFPTSWSVAPSTDTEKEEYRKQELTRYQQPKRAFTYRLHGYRSVVGPVRSGARTARGSALLEAGRPPYVTLLALVRDAVARLPNGQGTRTDIQELLKDSGYLVNAADSVLASAVGSALDRLHSEPDPCVRYNMQQKMWVYLHRHRTESEMEAAYRQHRPNSRVKRTIVKRSSALGGDGGAGAGVGVGTMSLLKPRVSAYTAPRAAAPAGPDVPATHAAAPNDAKVKVEPALTQTELAVRSIMPLSESAEPAVADAGAAPAEAPAALVKTERRAGPAEPTPPAAADGGQTTPTLAGASVKLLKNQHAIVHIPSKTPGAAPQLALFANGKLIPIVNQTQVKSPARPATSGGGVPAQMASLSTAGVTSPAPARPVVSHLHAAAVAGVKVKAVGVKRVAAAGAVSSAAGQQVVRMPAASTAARGPPVPSASVRFHTVRPAQSRPQQVSLSAAAAVQSLLAAGGDGAAAGAAARLTVVPPLVTPRCSRPAEVAPAALLVNTAPRVTAGAAASAARPAAAALAPRPPRLSLTLPTAQVLSPSAGARPTVQPLVLSGAQVISPRASAAQLSPRITTLVSSPRLATIVQPSSSAQPPTAAAAGGVSSPQLKQITIPVSQLSRLLQQQGSAVGGAGAPLTLAQIGGKQVLIAARPPAAAAGTTGCKANSQGAVSVQLQSVAAVSGALAAGGPAASSRGPVGVASSAASQLQLSTVARQASVGGGGGAGAGGTQVLLPTLKGLHGYRLVQVPAAGGGTGTSAAAAAAGALSVAPTARQPGTPAATVVSSLPRTVTLSLQKPPAAATATSISSVKAAPSTNNHAPSLVARPPP